MGKEVVSTNQFSAVLEHLFECVPQYYSENTIRKLLDSVEEYKISLSDNPLLGQVEPIVEYLNKGYRRLVVKPRFKIIYRDSPEAVYLVDIWDNRQDPEKLARRLK